MSVDYLKFPIDPTSAARLADSGLRIELIDENDEAVFTEWSQAVVRGFHGPRDTPEQIAQRIQYFGERRASAVYDDAAADAASPVATIDVWVADLTVPGHRSLPSWAISAVTVAPTHRRKGIASAMLTAELRTAAALDIPVAVLTVSESTIYAHWGFGVAALARDLTIETKRVTFTAPAPEGRVQLITREQAQVDGYELVKRLRLENAGEIEYGGILWDRQLGLRVGDESAKALRFVRFDSPDGSHDGFAIYKMKENDDDFTKNTLELLYLISATDAAYEGLWRYVTSMDLTTTVKAWLRPLDEPLRWLVSDFRAIKTSDTDHLWIRILDVKRTLEARTYATPGRVVLEILDPLGFAAGSWAIEAAADGTAVVESVAEAPDLTISVNDLASIYLGAVSATTLARTGRVTGDAQKVDSLFATPTQPWLSIWF